MSHLTAEQLSQAMETTPIVRLKLIKDLDRSHEGFSDVQAGLIFRKNIKDLYFVAEEETTTKLLHMWPKLIEMEGKIQITPELIIENYLQCFELIN